MKKVITFVLLFVIVLNNVPFPSFHESYAATISSEGAELSPEQVLSVAYDKLSSLSSVRVEMNMKVEEELSFILEKVSAPMTVSFSSILEYQREPLRTFSQNAASVSFLDAASDQDVLLYCGRDSSLMFYYSIDNGASWYSIEYGETGLAPLDMVTHIIRDATGFDRVGTEPVNSRDTAVYTGIAKGENANRLIRLFRVFNLHGADSMSEVFVNTSVTAEDLNKLGDIPVSLYIDCETGLPIRCTLDLTVVLGPLMRDGALSIFNMRKEEMEVVIPSIVVDCYLSQFNSVATFDIPENVRSGS